MKCVPKVTTVLVPFNRSRIFICYAIFFVVRAEENSEVATQGRVLQRSVQGSLDNDKSATGENVQPFLSAVSWNGAARKGVVLQDGNDEVNLQSFQPSVELPPPTLMKDCRTAEDDPGGAQQNFCKTGRRDVMKDKPFQNAFSFIPVLAPTSKHITNKACREQSRTFLRQLQRYKPWALHMYDASAKLPSGMLRGNVNQLGDFDQCLSVATQENPRIFGKYCLASVDVQATELNNGTKPLAHYVQLAQAYGFIKSTYRDPGHFIPQFTTIKWALCVPASCSYSDVQQTLVDALQDYNQTTGLNFDVHVDPKMCYVKHETVDPLSAGTVITLMFFALVTCVAMLATIRDTGGNEYLRHDRGSLKDALMAFSLRKNIRQLLADLPADGDINCIYGVRALCTITLYLAHKVLALGFTPYSNRVALTEISNERWTVIFRTSMVYTDSFLMLSGVLTSFNMCKEIERKKKIDWIKKYVARFVRLTPALLAVILFYAYVMEHLGTGPQWNMVVRKNADICKEHFWKNFLYIQNFFPFEQMCAAHTHQLALDMQLSLLSPLLVTLLWQRRVGGVVLLLCLHALSAILRYIATLRNHLSLVIFHGMTVRQLHRTANLTYTLSLHRANPYLLGVGLGYVLQKTSQSVQIPKVAAWAGWLLAIYFAYLSMFLPSNLGLRHYHYNVHEASIYATFSPISWSLALGWLIWACFTGNGGALNTFLCCKPLVIFSRISYAVYLTQFAVFYYNVGSVRASEQFSLSRSVDIAELLTVVIASVLLTLLFDLPMQQVKSILAGGVTGSRRAKVT